MVLVTLGFKLWRWRRYWVPFSLRASELSHMIEFDFSCFGFLFLASGRVEGESDCCLSF